MTVLQAFALESIMLNELIIKFTNIGDMLGA
jgi:hypothetical protein